MLRSLVVLFALVGCGSADDFAPWGLGAKGEDSLDDSSKPICSRFRFSQPRDHNELLRHLGRLTADEIKQLFACLWLGEGIDSSRYPELMQTEPYKFDWERYAEHAILSVTSQYWYVHWAKPNPNLLSQLLPLARDLFNELAYVKKEFPTQQPNGSPGARWIFGQTSFGYSDLRAHANPTPNTIWERTTADGLPILLMGYSDKPWHLGETKSGPGFVDYFRFLTNDIIIARGNYGRYDPSNPRPDSNFLSPGELQFWMHRETASKEINFNQGTTYFSVPMMRYLWHNATPASFEELQGAWLVDHVLNSAIVPVASISAAKDWAESAVLKKVKGADVFVLRSCKTVRSPQEALKLPGTEVLPRNKELYLPQYLEGDEDLGRSYCAYYLIR